MTPNERVSVCWCAWATCRLHTKIAQSDQPLYWVMMDIWQNKLYDSACRSSMWSLVSALSSSNCNLAKQLPYRSTCKSLLSSFNASLENHSTHRDQTRPFANRNTVYFHPKHRPGCAGHSHSLPRHVIASNNCERHSKSTCICATSKLSAAGLWQGTVTAYACAPSQL